MITYLTTLKKIYECRNIHYAVINDVVRNAIPSKLTFLETREKNVVLNTILQDNQRSSSCCLGGSLVASRNWMFWNV